MLWVNSEGRERHDNSLNLWDPVKIRILKLQGRLNLLLFHNLSLILTVSLDYNTIKSDTTAQFYSNSVKCGRLMNIFSLRKHRMHANI